MTQRAHENGIATRDQGHPAAQRLALALGLVCAAQFVLQLDFSIVNVALATIQREFGMSPGDLQWIVTGYALPFGSLLLLGGRIGDMTGHRRLLISGLVLFGLTSLGAGLAPDAGALIGFRFLQGASAALVAPMALAEVTDLYSDGPARNRALGIFQGATAGGATAGIVLGGILTQYVGWRSIFLVNPPVIVILVAVMLKLLPAGHKVAKRSRLDVGGAAAVTASVAALIYGLTQGQQNGFTSPPALTALVLAVVLAAAFAITERRVAVPLIPFRVLADPGRRAALLAQMLVSVVVAGYVYFIALYMQRVLGYSALVTGLGLIPSTLSVMTMSVLVVRRLLARWSARTVLLIGLTLVCFGQVWMSQLTSPGDYPVHVLPGIIGTSLGMGLVFPTASIAVTARMAPGERGLAGGMFAMAQQVGLAVGLAVLATVAAARTRAVTAPGISLLAAPPGALTSGYRLAFTVAACTVAVTFILTAILLRPGRAPS